MSSWTCPACARRVPGHVETCRCGAARSPESSPVPVAPPSATKAPGKSRVVGLTFAILGGILGSFLVRTVWSSGFGSSKVSIEELTETASRLNKMLPMRVDRYTELVNTVGLPGTFVYRYRLVDLSSDGVDPALLAKLEQAHRKQVTNVACTTQETRDKLLNRGVTMRYQYSDSAGREVMRFDVTSADCTTARR